jgi:hypothetical protein
MLHLTLTEIQITTAAMTVNQSLSLAQAIPSQVIKTYPIDILPALIPALSNISFP